MNLHSVDIGWAARVCLRLGDRSVHEDGVVAGQLERGSRRVFKEFDGTLNCP